MPEQGVAAVVSKAEELIRGVCAALSLTVRSFYAEQFTTPPGVTAVAILEESSFIVHTYIEKRRVTFDLTVGISGSSLQYIEALLAKLDSQLNRIGVTGTRYSIRFFSRDV